MLLTLKPPSNHTFKSFHDYSPPTPPSTSRFSPSLISSGPAFPPPARNTTPPSMSTPHRGLPPPAALALPPSQSSQSQPAQAQSQPLAQQHFGQLPAPPQQWHGAEDSMRTWLQAKAEEDKRRQEEEKTAQESLRLEQRRIEHDILRTSLGGGIPPHLIPLVFAGMGGGNLPSAGLEWAQRYLAQEQQQLQQVPQQQQLANPLPAAQAASPMLRREDRQISHPYVASQVAPAPVPSTPIASLPQQPPFAQGQSYPGSPRSRTQLPGPSALSRTPQSAGLPRLNTGEVQILQPQISATPQSQPQQTLPSEPSPQQSPGIYFHHWQPPTSQAPAPSTQPPTPSDPSHSSSSPKKRKAQGPPAAGQQHHSPPFSQPGPSRRRAHSHRSGSLDQARRGRLHDGEGHPRSPEGYGYVETEQGGRRNTLHSDTRHSLPMPQQQQQQQPQRGTEWRYEDRTPERDRRRRE